MAALERVTYEDPECEPTTKVEVWCYSCSDAIMIQVIVPKAFHPHPDVGSYNAMRPLTEFLNDKANKE